MFKLLCSMLLTFLTLCFTSSIVDAGSPGNSQRDFWSPTYHIERLNYCLIDGKTCGIVVAKRYCKLMGYQDAARAVKQPNVGFTHYLATNATCKGWRCDGFKIIQCSNRITHKPAASYYYRTKKFVLPRFANYRVAWCLEKNKGCGKASALSFCRRLGYVKTHSFKQEKALPATKALGNQELCFGQGCSGFSEITCYR